MTKNVVKIIAAVFLAGMLPVMAAAQAPRITKPADRSSAELGKQIDIAVSGSNLEITWIVLSGEPNPKSENEPRKAQGTISSPPYSIPADKINDQAYENKWLKIIARDTVSKNWSSPVYVKITPIPQAKPVVNGLNDRKDYAMGNMSHFSVSYSSGVKAYCIGLNGSPNPNPSNPLKGEPYFMIVEAHYTGSDSGGANGISKFLLPRMISPDWRNKWVKVIAQRGNTWSDPVYIRLTPPPLVADKVSNRGIVVTARTEVTSEGGVLVKKGANGIPTATIFLPEKDARSLYMQFTTPTTGDAVEAIAFEAAGLIPVVGNFISAFGLGRELKGQAETRAFSLAYQELNKNPNNSFLRVTVRGLAGIIEHKYECVTKPQYLQAGDGDFYKMRELQENELAEYFFYGARFKR